MIEANIEKPICTWAEADGWFVRKLRWIAHVGAPDRVFIKGGRTVFIEFKKPDGKRGPLQEDEIRHIIEHGGEAYFVDGLEQGCKILGLDYAANAHSSQNKRRARSMRGPIWEILEET